MNAARRDRLPVRSVQNWITASLRVAVNLDSWKQILYLQELEVLHRVSWKRKYQRQERWYAPSRLLVFLLPIS